MPDGRRGLSPSDTATLDLTPSPRGTRIRLRVKPGARKNEVLGVHAGALKLSVTAPPDKGKANKAVLRLLAETLDLPASAIELTSGHGSQDKTVLVSAPPAQILLRLA
jgi:uncharacterized protein (TIGR00251 family)